MPRRPEYTDAKTLPTIATPRVPPSWRVVSLTAEPTAALSADSDPMIASVAGAVVNPRPARRTNCGRPTADRLPAEAIQLDTIPIGHFRRPIYPDNLQLPCPHILTTL